MSKRKFSSPGYLEPNSPRPFIPTTQETVRKRRTDLFFFLVKTKDRATVMAARSRAASPGFRVAATQTQLRHVSAARS